MSPKSAPKNKKSVSIKLSQSSFGNGHLSESMNTSGGGRRTQSPNSSGHQSESLNTSGSARRSQSPNSSGYQSQSFNTIGGGRRTQSPTANGHLSESLNTSGSGGGRRGRRRQSLTGMTANMKKIRSPNYGLYIRRILQELHPDMSIASSSVLTFNSFIADIFERIAMESSKLVKKTQRSTIGSKEIHAAVKLVIPGALSTHAISEAAKAMQHYRNSKYRSNGEDASQQEGVIRMTEDGHMQCVCPMPPKSPNNHK